MLHGNQETPSKLRTDHRLLCSFIDAVPPSGISRYENFRRLQRRRCPGRMPSVGGTAGPGTWDASSGDYVATGSTPRVTRVLDYVLGNTSATGEVGVTGAVGASYHSQRSPVPVIRATRVKFKQTEMRFNGQN